MPPRRPDLPALTGLRFVAAVAVMIVHLRGHVRALLPATAPFDPALSAGALGVDLFFVLSGFILGYHYLDAFPRLRLTAWTAFLRHRLARIYPLHVATLAFLALFVGLLGLTGRSMEQPEAYALSNLWSNVLLVQCWTLHDCGLSWNGPAWSLSAEWLAYLAFPLLALGARRVRPGLPLLLAIVTAVAGQYALSEWAQMHGGIARIAGTFTLGLLLARAHLEGVPALRWDVLATWTAATGSIVAMGLATAGLRPTPVIPLFGLLVLSLANAPDSRLSRLLAGPRLLFWGQASYGLYMTHALVLAVGAEFIRLELVASASLPVRIGLLVGYVVSMLVVAAVAYHEVERPWRSLLAGRRRTPAPATLAVAAPSAGLLAAPLGVPTPLVTPLAAPASLAGATQHMAQSAPTR